jgi:hypothetical protein
MAWEAQTQNRITQVLGVPPGCPVIQVIGLCVFRAKAGQRGQPGTWNPRFFFRRRAQGAGRSPRTAPTRCATSIALVFILLVSLVSSPFGVKKLVFLCAFFPFEPPSGVLVGRLSRPDIRFQLSQLCGVMRIHKRARSPVYSLLSRNALPDNPGPGSK